jgi:membrane protease YdiL (CAAX protease family)
MTDSKKVLSGLAIGISIHLIAVVSAHLVKSITANSVMAYVTVPLVDFVLAAAAIWSFVSKGAMQFQVRRVMLKPSVVAILVTLVATFTMGVASRLLVTVLGFTYPQTTQVSFMTPLQVFLFIFVFGSIAEETLFRGYVQRMLAPLKASGMQVLQVRLSLPVIISAVLFGLAHFSLLGRLSDMPHVTGIAANATVMGLVAGYYQEKYDNFSYAALVHMAANFPIVIMMLAA